MRFLLLAVLLLTLPAGAQDASPPLLLRLKVEQEGPVWVGQRVTVTLIAMTPVRFVDPPAWPDITASEGRVIVLPEAATLPGTERMGTQSYAALMRTYSVFPATPGDLVLAPLSIRARVGGEGGQAVEATAGTEPIRLAARVPPGVSDLKRLIVAPSFSLKAETEGPASELRVGDAVTRIVRMQADDTTSMMLPPAIWAAPEGVRVYPDPPALQDHTDRGELRALRTERASFVPERSGEIELPGYAVSWLDPRRGQVQQVMVPPLRLHVLPAGPSARVSHVPWWTVAAAAAALLALAGGAWWLLRRHRHASRDALDEFVHVCRAGDPRATLRALYRWADSVAPGGGERTIARLAQLARTPDLATQAGRLEAALYGNGAQWDGEALTAAVHATQRSLERSGTWKRREDALPPLNPRPAAAPPPRLTQPRWAR